LNSRKKPLHGSKILVLGIAYKKDVDDLRESPALTIIDLLRRAGAEVAYHDPYFPVVEAGRHYDINLTCASLSNLGAYDCVLIVTDHSEYDYAQIANEAQLLVDTRNATRGIASPKVVRC
jgi:UDP-N-acetyl-D-glucosamine dehydrogenase